MTLEIISFVDGVDAKTSPLADAIKDSIPQNLTIEQQMLAELKAIRAALEKS